MRAIKWNTSAIKVQKAGEGIRPLKECGNLVMDSLRGWRPYPGSVDKGEYYSVRATPAPPEVTNKMEPWQAYWIYAYEDCALILPPPHPIADGN
jgi:hypothetical protein